MKRVVLFGYGPVAAMAHFYLTHDSPHEVVAFTADRAHINQVELFGLPVVPFEEVQTLYPPSDFGMFIAVGYARMNKLREEKYRQAKALGYELITYVSSKATTWPGTAIGDNCFIMEHVLIQPFATIGNNIILWSSCNIGHETVIGDNCFVSSHAVVAGFVTVEANCFLGTNSTIRDGIKIARESVIGAGAVILKATRERGVYVAPQAQLLEITSDRLPKL